jgi:MFS family permease
VEESAPKSKTIIYRFQKADYRLFPLLLSYLFFTFFILSDSFFIITAKESGYITAYLPLLMIALTLTQTLFSYYFGIMSDRKSTLFVLRISYLFGILSIGALLLNLIAISFVFLGVFTVASLNAARSYISINAINKASIYGIFYAGIALFSSLGALSIGYIWHYFGQESALCFSLFGMIITFVVSLLKIDRASE